MSSPVAPSNGPLSVLGVFRAYNTVITVFNAENFRGHDRNIFARNVFRAIAAAVLYVGMLLVFALNLHSSFDANLDWTQREFQLVIVLLIFQQMFMALSLSLQNRKIYGSFDRIQRSLADRKIVCCLIIIADWGLEMECSHRRTGGVIEHFGMKLARSLYPDSQE